MSPVMAVTGLLAGVLLAPALRAQMYLHSVPSGQPWQANCHQCDRPIRLIGWRARCSGCDIRLGPPPATVEIVVASALALLIWRVDETLPLLALAWTVLIGTILVFVDFAVHRLPDRLTFTAFAGAGVLFGIHDPARAGWALLGGLGLGACYLLLILASRNGMGPGDAKLALVVGSVLGWFGWVAVIYGAAAGFLFSGLFALAMLASGRLTRKDSIAHGPFMLIGALVAISYFA